VSYIDDTLTLQWSEAMYATGYTVWFGTESGVYTDYVDTTDTSVELAVTPDTTYYCAVLAKNANCESDKSDELVAIPDSQLLSLASSVIPASLSSIISASSEAAPDSSVAIATKMCVCIAMTEIVERPFFDCDDIKLTFDKSWVGSWDWISDGTDDEGNPTRHLKFTKICEPSVTLELIDGFACKKKT
jgi:hypothetical protein